MQTLGAFRTVPGVANAIKVGVFGATPNLFEFRNFNDTVRREVEDILELRATKTPLRSVIGRSAKLFCNAYYDPKTVEGARRNLDVVAQALPALGDHGCFEESANLFLDFGIHRKKILKHITYLLETAARSGCDALVHMFFPPYMRRVTPYEGEVETLLSCGAGYYKSLYLEAIANGASELPVYIVIPQVHHFTNYCSLTEGEQLVSSIPSIVSTLTDELFDPLSSELIFALINQNEEQNAELCEGIDHAKYLIDALHLLIYDGKGRLASNNFTPYCLKHKGNKIINKELLKRLLEIGKLVEEQQVNGENS